MFIFERGVKQLCAIEIFSERSLTGRVTVLQASLCPPARVVRVELTTFRSFPLILQPAHTSPCTHLDLHLDLPLPLIMSASTSLPQPSTPAPSNEKYNLRQLDIPRPDGMRALSRREDEALQKEAKMIALKECHPFVKGEQSI